ncbi:MAG: fatty acid desaturase [Gemmataceae bacterium]|nr:fatty acid desaturase [Gemmataceae bacterium]
MSASPVPAPAFVSVLHREPPADMPIPNRLNIALAAAVFGGAVFLLWLGSWVENGWATLGIGVMFSYLLLTNYALFHEAAHGNLHANPRVNHILGVITGMLFPMPFSMMRVTHQGHHLRNRTDHEMFDLYYPTDNRFIRFVQWYGILFGLFWPWVPIGAVLFALCPGVLRTRVFRKARSSNYLLGDIRDVEVRSIRLEVALTVVLFVSLSWLLALHWVAVLVMYACFSVNWSTRQYVGHAFSRRDVIDGAWNLEHNPVMSWVLLHGEWDLNHHRRPEVPWYYLPRVSAADAPRVSYIRQYWRQWIGPQPSAEPAPESLRQLPLSIHR